MLELANVGKDDVVYDVYCGDGRVVVMAVKDFGATRAVGLDTDPECIKECQENARISGVADRVEWREEDLLKADLRPASVVTCYLLPDVNLALRPNLFRDFKPGNRVVSHAFDMGGWAHDELLRHKRARNNAIYLWIIPAPVGGTWEWTGPAKGGEAKSSLALEQEFQSVRGVLSVPGSEPVPIAEAKVRGRDFGFSATVKVDGQPIKIAFSGVAEGDTIKGTQEWSGGPNAGKRDWAATRKAVDLVGSWQIEVKSAEQQGLGGMLEIARKEWYLAATYTANRDKKPVPLDAFYVWGSSVRFDLPADEKQAAVFRGTLAGDGGSGVVQARVGDPPSPWSARRMR
jgi:SAM-dependent methyltransferase